MFVGTTDVKTLRHILLSEGDQVGVALEMLKVVFVYYGKTVLECDLKMMAAVICFKCEIYNTLPFTTAGIIDRHMR